MEGVDVVRQAAEEAVLDLLPDYETEVLEEGEIPPIPPTEDPLRCPIHYIALQPKVSERGWSYVQCEEKGCPIWSAKDSAPQLCSEWEMQACEDVRDGPFTCYCDRPYKLVISQKSDKGNQGRLFLTCRQDPRCRFFQWADQPRERKHIRLHHELCGNTYSRENRWRRDQTKRQKLVKEAFVKPVTPYHHPYQPKEYQTSQGKRIEPRVKQLREIHFDKREDRQPYHPHQAREVERRYPAPDEVDLAMQRAGFTHEDYKRYSLCRW